MHIPCEEIRTQTLVPVCASGCYQPTWFRDHIWCHHHFISMSDSSNLNPLFAGRAPRASTKWHFRLWFISQSLTLPCLLLPLVWIWHLGFTVLGSNPGPHPNNASTLPTELYPQPVANIKSAHGGQFPPLCLLSREQCNHDTLATCYGKTVLCRGRNTALIQLMCKVGLFNLTFHIIRTQAGKRPIRWQFQIPMVIIAPVFKVSCWFSLEILN